MAEKQIYTYVSGKAAKGIQRLARGREVHVMASPTGGEYTVVTVSKDKARPSHLIGRKRSTQISAEV